MVLERNWSPNTRNHRLSCIRSFFRFASTHEPTLAIYVQGLMGIPLSKSLEKSHVIKFLSLEAIKILLQQPDTTTKIGIRDVFFMLLMYDTAARNSELLSMKLCDFDKINKRIYVIGKGNKARFIPVKDDTINLFNKYIKIYHPSINNNDLLFYILHHNEKIQMSDDNVGLFIQKYAALGKNICPEIPSKVTPHMLRHSRAMHLYRSGMPLSVITQWLGHKNPETTLQYAYADTEMKRRALEKAEVQCPMSPIAEVGMWEGDEDIIKRLCGFE
jgi:site-specific recombinase XerD